MYDAVNIAYYMLKVAEGNSQTMTNLKLQKLVYIAHGYMLAMKDRRLINEAPQAWKYGPVIHSVYKRFRAYEDRKIDCEIPDVSNLIDGDAKFVIEGVMRLYGNDTAIQLVNLTHEPETPWDEVWNKQGGSDQLFAEISDGIIKKHFKKAIDNPTSVNGL